MAATPPPKRAMAGTPPPPKRRSLSLLDLHDDLIPEILLRLRPHDPRGLVRCSAVCKLWRRHLTDPAFLRRYRAFHGVPPMLGALFYLERPDSSILARFVRTTPFRPRTLDHSGCYVRDSRHGRILFSNFTGEENNHDLFVWNPITEERWGLAMPTGTSNWNAAVLCAAAARQGDCDCDHLDCQGGPFLVAFVDTNEEGTSACVYSSETDAWSDAAHIEHPNNLDGGDMMQPSALVGNRIYFSAADSQIIVEYDLGRRILAFVDPPLNHKGRGILLPAMGGGLGFANVRGSCLYLWSRETGSDRTAAWTQNRVLELNTLPGCVRVPPLEQPTAADLADFFKEPTAVSVKKVLIKPRVVGSAGDLGIIFVRTGAGVFAVDMKSGRVKRISSRTCIDVVTPYMSFYTPDHAMG